MLIIYLIRQPLLLSWVSWALWTHFRTCIHEFLQREIICSCFVSLDHPGGCWLRTHCPQHSGEDSAGKPADHPRKCALWKHPCLSGLIQLWSKQNRTEGAALEKLTGWEQEREAVIWRVTWMVLRRLGAFLNSTQGRHLFMTHRCTACQPYARYSEWKF